MLECQCKLAKSANRDSELFHCFRYEMLIPRRHERKMNICGRYELDGRLLQLSRQSSQLTRDLGHDFHADEDAHLCGRNSVPTLSRGVDFVRRHIYPYVELLNEAITALPRGPCKEAVHEGLERHRQHIPGPL